MKRVYKYKEQRQLMVGETYNFRVVKQVKLPDNEQYYILEDPFGERHLLPEKYYQAYNIKVNEFYPCHVDKVNCQGRIFLEPQHPYFQLNNIYEFKFAGTKNYLNKKGREVAVNLMRARNNYTAYLEIISDISDLHSDRWIKFKVEKIKKAQVFLTPP